MPLSIRRSMLAIAVSNAIFLSGCGGGSTSQADAGQYAQANDNPRAASSALGVDSGAEGAYSSIDGFVVNAGDPQQADQGVDIVFNGRVAVPSGDQLASLKWTQIAGSSVQLTGADSDTLLIETPHVEKSEKLVFRLTATDVNGNNASDTVSVVVRALQPFARISNAAVSEDKGELVLPVTLSEEPHSPISVRFEIQPITAQFNSDYSLESGKVEFAAGQQTASIRIPLVNDQTAENTETFLIKLLASDSVGVAIDSAVVSILDDDGAKTVSFKAMLGPIAGATVSVTDFSGEQRNCETKTNASTDLNQAGRFSIPLSCLNSGGPKLITVSGGQDLDVNDDKVLDPEPLKIARVFRAVVDPSVTDFSKTLFVSAITEAAYLRSTQVVLSDDSAIGLSFTQSAKALLKQDLNHDGKIDSADLLYWNPAADRNKFKKEISLLDQTRDSILYGVETSADLDDLAHHLWVDPIGQLYADREAENSNTYRTRVTAVDGSHLFYSMHHYTQMGEAASINAINFPADEALNKTTIFSAYAPNLMFDALEAVAGNLVLRRSNGDVYGEHLDIFPYAPSGESSTGSFNVHISPIDYSTNGLIAGTSALNALSGFMQVAHVSATGLNIDSAHPGSSLALRQAAECPVPGVDPTGPVSSGLTLLFPDSIVYKVEVLNPTTIAAFYHSHCVYSNESAWNYQHRVAILSVSQNNVLSLKSTIILDDLPVENMNSSGALDVIDAVSYGSQLFLIDRINGLRQVDMSKSQVVKTLNPSVLNSETGFIQVPEELSLDGSALYELVADTHYQSDFVSSRALVIKYDVSKAAAINEVGRIGVEGAAFCSILPDGFTSIRGRTMSVGAGNLILNFAFQGVSTTGFRFDYLGTLQFDAGDVTNDKTYTPERNFVQSCAD